MTGSPFEKAEEVRMAKYEVDCKAYSDEGKLTMT